ncbi:MAG: zinc ribbon domain-containing protein [Candidatus Marinarcus sp.]|uniref:zinc ribbon domain-containing protein n=1 Tax=Candidatus Marinarcus sp. TaxID=3100987 RepID=UPI003AFFF112
MNKYLEQLVQLSKYDSKISAYEPQIENEKAKLAVFLQTAESISSSIDATHAEIDDLKSKRTKNNIHLSELKVKLDEITKKNNVVQNEKELKALQLEEEIAKEQISFANEEISRLDDLMQSKEAYVKELEDKLAQEKEEINDLQVAVDNAIEDLNKDRNNVYQERAVLLEQFDNKILTFYEKIRRWAKDKAVVPVRKQACYGCYMKINDKAYADVIKAEEIVNCPHCGRILYKEVESEEA